MTGPGRDTEERWEGASSSFGSVWRSVSGPLAWLLLWSVVASLLITLCCISLQVFMRYFLGAPPSWAEEVAMLSFSWSALGALPLGVREGFHVRIDLVTHLADRAREMWERALNLLVAAFGLFLLYAGWRFVELTAGGRSAAARYPIELLHVMAPLSGLLLLVFAIERVVAPPADKPPPELPVT